MGDDQVTVDPEFLPPSRGSGDRGPKSGWIAAGAAVVVAFILGWLLASPTATEPDATGRATSNSTTTTRNAPATTATTTTAANPVTYAGFDAPLLEEVPGFTDTIVMLATPTSSFDMVRWRSSSPTTELMLSLDRGAAGWGSGGPMGLDASGGWFAEQFDDGLLVVHGGARDSEDPELIGLRVESSVWHDTDPGRIAWMACPRAEGSATLFTLDLADSLAEPVPVRSFETGCGAAWVEHWGTRGVVIGGPFATDRILVDAEGSETPIEPGSRLAAEGPDGSTLRIRSDDGSASWFLLSPDGRHREVVPGPAGYSSAALWSPDGAYLALWIEEGEPVLRIVNPTSGRVLTEVAKAGLDLVNSAWAWSTDGRFLLYQRQVGGRWALVFYDTATDTSTEVPLFDVVDEIRITEPEFEVFVQSAEAELDVDASGAAATGGTPLPDFASAIPGDDGDEPLPLGVVPEIPASNRLDFLYEGCDGETACFRDAVFVDREKPSLVSSAWQADRPFHVRHGFINESDEPLSDAFDVVLYVHGMDFTEVAPTYRYTSDYVLRGTTDACGPTYRTSTGPVTCEWFVHEFADGFPAGRFALWAFWEAPCSAWIDYGFVDSCTDPDEVLALFASGVDSPWATSGVAWDRN